MSYCATHHSRSEIHLFFTLAPIKKINSKHCSVYKNHEQQKPAQAQSASARPSLVLFALPSLCHRHLKLAKIAFPCLLVQKGQRVKKCMQDSSQQFFQGVWGRGVVDKDSTIFSNYFWYKFVYLNYVGF